MVRASNNKKIIATFVLTLALSMSACTPIKQARDVDQSGFLGDYSMLQEGKDGEALKIYINPQYQQSCKGYDKVIIEPVTMWVRDKSDLADLSAADRQTLVNHLHGSLVNEIGKHYQVVSTPQPGTLRIKTAITEAEGSWVALDTVSSFVPQLLVMSKLKEIATGTGSFVGKASGEADITDAITGERIAAAADRIVGAKSVTGVTSKWDDVTRAFDFWAGRMAYRLVNCGAKPTE
ncbi:MAG: DUF3313 domain-containing protein [Methylococcaceae bacterium]|nr:DUF3313 domain-containing protein [Methylococcaceae bacterium]MDZ4156184.1 DUF3313 domain-containing protein [Methylococcales bacterium]MDP2393762.1 DUF3313 domain-containing protein [Methylococcaceae bacterium]MDP3019788.1 DUF3313 domain-containing protein [Methylococcaceae bacterium]MDP3389607.1 DUF3313 domain-containing protein [Methylococcaceae bacterium]